jgi:hypothetical protein
MPVPRLTIPVRLFTRFTLVKWKEGLIQGATVPWEDVIHSVASVEEQLRLTDHMGTNIDGFHDI